MQIRRALRGECVTVAGAGEYATLARCSQRNVPAAERVMSWRLGGVFDRSAAMTAPGGGGATIAADGPKRGS